MNTVIVPTSVYGAEEVLEKGQDYFVPIIAQAGSMGIEIRRELFPKGELPLKKLRNVIKEKELFSVYSAPVEVWKQNGELNKEVLKGIFSEAVDLGVNIVKFSLGNYRYDCSNMTELKALLADCRLEDYELTFTIENDQTSYGGSIEKLSNFFENAAVFSVPVKMTFDIGNWQYSGEEVSEAVKALAGYVTYVHCKHVESKDGKLMTLPLPVDEKAAWREILLYFPNDIPKAIEFPIPDTERTKEYVALVENA
ncbi:sugar phosphate isomerase/epimerase family protein [Bacillus taeanensis]|uniref:Sugar phosphate isomerase/epimerase n=1 Tax=Bacillus taeanensis TaxID=273032 RepID=A0A366XTJ3_9BACI|nr:sugar phosphate isomerase/epimerase [Bacillus taeanensis]RBW68465.1 hypothetical protein DS031_16770 [Bacillus taeanensis]